MAQAYASQHAPQHFTFDLNTCSVAGDSAKPLPWTKEANAATTSTNTFGSSAMAPESRYPLYDTQSMPYTQSFAQDLNQVFTDQAMPLSLPVYVFKANEVSSAPFQPHTAAMRTSPSPNPYSLIQAQTSTHILANAPTPQPPNLPLFVSDIIPSSPEGESKGEGAGEDLMRTADEFLERLSDELDARTSRDEEVGLGALSLSPSYDFYIGEAMDLDG
ncbi:MAG: hypothetical protein Q9191_002487 [Dirinaria sp. TL-2023a]